MNNNKIKGGKLPVGQLKELLNSSYDNILNDVPPWIIDKPLSDEYVQVYTNNNNKNVVVVHRGTKGLKDVITDVKLMFGFRNNNRYKDARKKQKAAEDKYGINNISVIGHSLGADIAREVSNPNIKEIILLNKPVTPSDILSKKKIQKPNIFTIKTKLDPVSILQPLEENNKNDIVIPSTTINPLKEHSVNTLDRLDEDKLIGLGIKNINKLKIRDLKLLIKNIKKQKKLKDIKISNLNKTELLNIYNSIK
jgi:hypothetical protein